MILSKLTARRVFINIEGRQWSLPYPPLTQFLREVVLMTPTHRISKVRVYLETHPLLFPRPTASDLDRYRLWNRVRVVFERTRSRDSNPRVATLAFVSDAGGWARRGLALPTIWIGSREREQSPHR